MKQLTYGGHTAEALREFIACGEKCGEGIDSMLGDEAAGSNIIRDLLDAIAPSDAAQAPQSWKLVPIKPTEEMLRAADSAGFYDHKEAFHISPCAAYKAMLDAAPVASAAAAPCDTAGLAHELWAAAQLAPGESITEGAERIEVIIARSAAVPGQRIEVAGRFVRRSMFGPWIEIGTPEDGSEVLYRFSAAQPDDLSERATLAAAAWANSDTPVATALAYRDGYVAGAQSKEVAQPDERAAFDEWMAERKSWSLFEIWQGGRASASQAASTWTTDAAHDEDGAQ